MIKVNDNNTMNANEHYKGINPKDPINICLFVDCKDSLYTYSAAPKDGKCMTNMVITKNLDIEGVSNFSLKLVQNNEELIELDGIFIDEWEKGSDEFNGDLARMVEPCNKVASEVFFTLQHWKEFVNVTDDNRNLFRCSVFIRRLFVNPNYRNMGVASFTLDHLDEFIYKKYGLNLTYVCTIVPSIYETEMRDVIERTLQNAGFTNIPEERPGDVYAKYYKGK